jgi:dUTP pyrophosphatase
VIQKPVLKLTYEKVHEDAIIPTYATIGDSGADIHAVEDYFIYPGKTRLIRTGLKVEIPIHPHYSSGYRWELQVRPRSGVSLKTKLRVANSPGTVDNFYRDEIKVIVYNEFFPYLQYEADQMGGLEIAPKQVMFAFLIDGTKVDLDEPVPYGTYLIRKHNRIAQIIYNEIIRPVEVEEGEVSGELSRGSAFGGTGINASMIRKDRIHKLTNDACDRNEEALKKMD